MERQRVGVGVVSEERRERKLVKGRQGGGKEMGGKESSGTGH